MDEHTHDDLQALRRRRAEERDATPVPVVPNVRAPEPVTTYFTFGVGHPLHDRYVKIVAPTRTEAREEMFRVFGKHWAFDYSEEQWRSPRAGEPGARDMAEAYGYTELPMTPEPVPVGPHRTYGARALPAGGPYTGPGILLATTTPNDVQIFSADEIAGEVEVPPRPFTDAEFAALPILKLPPLAGTRPLTPGQRAMIDALEEARTEVYRHTGGDPAGNLIGEHDHEDAPGGSAPEVNPVTGYPASWTSEAVAAYEWSLRPWRSAHEAELPYQDGDPS